LRKHILLLAGLTLIAGCRAKTVEQPALVELYTQVEGSVGFDVTPSAPEPDGTTIWHAVYTSPEGTTRFDLKLFPQQPSKDDPSIGFGKGTINAVAGSQPAPLLNALKIALEAKKLPKKTVHTETLPFIYADLGSGMVRDKDGGFDVKGHGTWSAIKLFLPTSDGQDDAEVYLNLSAAVRKGEFSIKDSDYGDDVLAALARVF
jgi:hypothetical protein